MRAASSRAAAQQTLTPEAASVLKHSLSLARRRGHAQVTPLHVAATLLSSRLSLLRRACLQSQSSSPSSHPLQCRALELCFNVALNRLPVASLGDYQPCLSNALIAALKRAQAHQRRGSDAANQPLVAFKVELDQLVVSILDDPSVSRVMNEAGFSSVSVKGCLGDASVFHCSYSSSPGGIFSTPNSPPSENPRSEVVVPVKDDVRLLIDALTGNNNKRRNCVIVGDSVSLTEGLVAGLMGKVEEGDVPADLKSARFIKFQFYSAPLMSMKKEEVELNVSELRRKVDACNNQGVVIYTGDLRWTVMEEQKKSHDYSYSPVNHLVEEIGTLVRSYSNSNAKVWLVGTATYRTYMRQPPLDSQWLIQPLFVPSAGLGLSLKAASGSSLHDTNMGAPLREKGECCPECMAKFEEEAGLHHSSSPFPNTMDWDKHRAEKDNVANLKRKWSSICEELHPQRHDEENARQGFFGKNIIYYSSSFPWWSSFGTGILDDQSVSFADNSFPKNKQCASSVPRFRRQKSCNIEFNGDSPNLESLKHSREDQNVRTTLSLGNSPVSDDAAADKSIEELVMCNLLQEYVPWQCGSIHTVVQALMSSKEMKRDTWFLIQGGDIIGKRRLARGIAQVLHGSPDSLIYMNLRNMSGKNCEMLKGVLGIHDKLVLLLENVDFLDVELSEFLENGFRYGMGTMCKDVQGKSCHPIFILTKSDDNAPSDSVVQMEILVSKGASSATVLMDSTVQNKIQIKEECLDLNMKADEEECGDEHNSLSFLHLIKNRLVFNRDPGQDKKIRKMFLSNITGSFEQVFRTRNLDFFSVQEKVVDEISLGSATFLHSVFQEWLKHAFQSSLKSISKEGSEQFKIRLCVCVRGNGRGDQTTGFKGSCLPMHIPVRYMD